MVTIELPNFSRFRAVKETIIRFLEFHEDISSHGVVRREAIESCKNCIEKLTLYAIEIFKDYKNLDLGVDKSCIFEL